LVEYDFKPDGTTFKDLSDEDRAYVQENMKATSKKPNKLPRKFYHATYQKNLSSILDEGLKPHEIFGEIYFCEKENQCLQFMDRRLPIIIFSIETSKLDPNEIYLSSDHVKTKNRNFHAYTYYKHISPELCKNWRRTQC